MSTLIFCFLLILEGFLALEGKNDFHQSMIVEANTSQNFMSPDINKHMEWLRSSENRTESYSTFEGDWNFSRANEWSDLAKIDDDSAELIIGLDHTDTSRCDEIKNIIRAYNGRIVNIVSMDDKIGAIVADIPFASIPSFIKKTKAEDISTYVEPNLKFKANFIPNDPYWNKQWGPIKIGADIAWNRQLGSSSLLVAVIDTGVDWSQPDLAANYVALGYDWVNNDTNPMDDNGHGTHCAGIIAAGLDNAVGIAGLAKVRIMAEKALDSKGYGYENNLANAIIHAVNRGAKILSNSWGGYEDSALIHDAIKYAYEKGVLIVAAAGNDAWDMKLFPAGYDEVIAVTATNASDNPASFTNFGNWVELAAPGVNIYSTVCNNGYAYMSGTSMACPHVSGVAALIWSQFPNATRDWVRFWLRYTSDDLGGPGFDVYYGYGRVNAERAVSEPPNHDLLMSDLEVPRYIEPGSVGKINSTIFNLGKSNETNIDVQLLVNGSIVDSVQVDFLASGVSRAVNFSWNPTIRGKYNITSYILPAPDEENISNNAKSAIVRVYEPEVALFQNVDPWDHSSDEEVLNLYDIPYVTLSSKDFESVNLSRFIKVIIASDQDQVFYEAMNSSRWWFENYVSNGGVLEIHAADSGWHGAHWVGVLPGGLQWETCGRDSVTVANRTHPVLNTPNRITDSELDGWSLSVHGCLSSYPNNSRIILVEDFGRPVLLEFEYGAGLVVASGQTLEWAYHHHYSLILENSLLYPVYKYEHELAVFLDVPTFVAPNNLSFLNATVMNYGFSNETTIDLHILIDGNTVESVTIPEIAAGDLFTFDLPWTPTREGEYNITAYTPPLLEEKVTLNNGVSEIVPVRYFKHILFDQTHGADNINCYITWIIILSNRGFIINLHTVGAITLDELNNYDVFVIPQADISYTPSELSAIQNFVLDGGGLLVIGDNEPSIYTELTRFAGITWSSGEASGVTRDISPHLVTAGVSSVSLVSPLSKINVTGVARGLVRLEGNIMLSVSVQSFGKVIGFADENSLWDIGIGGMDNLRLANNMIEWLSIPVEYEHEILVKLEAPAYLANNSSVLLNATVYNQGMNNETNVQLLILINGNVVDSSIIPELLTGSVYMLSYQWAPIINGVYNITAYSLPMQGEGNTVNNVMSKMVRVGCADVALIDVFANVTIAYVGWPVNIMVVAKNQGNFNESFSIIAYANSTVIGTQVVTSLAPSSQATLLFHWNTTSIAKGNYTLSAYATTVLGEEDTADNNYTDGSVLVTMIGDFGGGSPSTWLNFDGVVDWKDLFLFRDAYLYAASPLQWPYVLADLGGGSSPTFFAYDGVVDWKDLYLFRQCYLDLGP